VQLLLVMEFHLARKSEIIPSMVLLSPVL